MKLRHQIAIACICFGTICPVLPGTEQSSADRGAMMPQTSSEPTEREFGLQESTVEQADDLFEAYESNGPEAGRGVPMKRMSMSGFGLVMFILLAGGGLAALAGKTNTPDTCAKAE